MMTLEDLEFYGSMLRVEFEHTPDDPGVGFVGYCEIQNIWLADNNWFAKGHSSNFLTSGAVFSIRRMVEAYISAQEQVSRADRKAMAEV